MENNKSSKNLIISVVFLVWFFGSIGGMLYVAEIGKYWLMLALFGQYFLVFGIIGIASSISSGSFGFNNAPLLLFPLIGIGAIAASFIMQYGSESFKAACGKNVPNIALGLFFVIGVYMMVMWLRDTVLIKVKCTQRISAKCIQVKEQYHHSTNGGSYLVYCPVYEFYYNGNTHQVCDGKYTNMVYPDVGATYEIYINHNNPQQYYEPTRTKRMGIVMFILGVTFVGVSVFAFVMYNRF